MRVALLQGGEYGGGSVWGRRLCQVLCSGERDSRAWWPRVRLSMNRDADHSPKALFLCLFTLRAFQVRAYIVKKLGNKRDGGAE